MSLSKLLRLPPLASQGESHSLLTVTELDLTATQHAFEQGKQAYAAQNYDQAVELYTRALKSLQTDLESVILLHRATAWEKQNNYQRTVEDAELANPNESLTRPDPYFVRANALFFQTKLIEATRAYEKGLEMVLDKYSSERAILTDKFQQLTALIPQRNQWMIQLLPFEVLSRIFMYMDISGRVRFALTCRFWHNLNLHQRPALCHTLNIKEIAKASPFLAAIPPNVPKRINSELTGFGSSRAIKTVYEQGWNALESIEIEEGIPKLLEVLERNKNTLRSIKLHCWLNERRDTDSLVDVINACPNLQFASLSFDRPSDRRSGPFPHVLADSVLSNLHLTALSISEWTCSDKSLDSLLKQAPHLMSLKLRNRCGHVDIRKILQAVNEICPSLQEFSYTNEPAVHEDQHKTTVIYTHQQSSSRSYFRLQETQQTRGIKKITIKNSVVHPPHKPLYYDDEELRLMFIDCYQSLEVLELDHVIPQDAEQNWQPGRLGRPGGAYQLQHDVEYWSLRELGRLGAPQLQTLVLNFEKGVLMNSETISSLIAACPSLQVVRIEGTGFWHRRIFNVLADTVYLRKLSIVDTHYHQVSDHLQQIEELSIGGKGGEVEEDGFLRSGLWLLPVFQKAHRLVGCTFGVFGDHSATALVSQLAPYIARSSIRSLDLLTTPIRTTAELETILSSLSSSDALRSMYMSLSCYVTETDIATFAAIRNLAFLRIRNFTSEVINRDMLYTLFQHLQKRDHFALVHVSNHCPPSKDYPVIVKCHTHGTAASVVDRGDDVRGHKFKVEECYVYQHQRWIGK
ncbi:hypothetical protein BDB00DRAFT_938714 [Zychaea mexicana]|uniref:uncharacterized protein n=1 Tax=Zychaea mexicana TaxID=64656 RepID=UPI0022FF288B|nr:uncharacterized protein BDB00DRAFT_938714 [Zychaea mexicana]KAI9493953.1 hypothetical protein BDB00DRAFT_938714 [Zychaea mexicana]